ncbi:hypothetical protein CR513_01981, partial [Mucuna pruriens]
MVMPPKTSTPSLRGGRGRGRGKGFKLALREPSLKKVSTTSPRSSTQNAKQQEESYTQLVVKSKSSTKNTSKTQTTKQTKNPSGTPRLWSIKTSKENWANIASESDEESELDLKALIQKARDSKSICNTQKEKQILISAPLTTKVSNTYIYKNKFSNVLQMEPKFWDKNPYNAISKAFPLDFQFQPTAKNKTRIFYEFILIDSHSVFIKHFKDPKNPLLNTHSTIWILKVLQPKHFGTNLNEYKKFSQPFDSIGYTYWDYIDAWTKTNTEYNFPNWFFSWWNHFGPIQEIFPDQVQQGFAQFIKLYNSEESRILANLKYFSIFALAWIFSWQYRYNKTENSKHFPSLQRHFFVKWWNQFDASKAGLDKVKIWFNSNLEFLKPADPETSIFLNQKSQLAALLAGSKSREHLTKNLEEILKLLHSQEEAESSSKTEEANSPTNSSLDVFYRNEDDCFGINLNED